MDNTCPKCGTKLGFFYLKQTCPECGCDLLYYNMEARLEADAVKAEAEWAKFDKFTARLGKLFKHRKPKPTGVPEENK